jgi:hypothetical protein
MCLVQLTECITTEDMGTFDLIPCLFMPEFGEIVFVWVNFARISYISQFCLRLRGY